MAQLRRVRLALASAVIGVVSITAGSAFAQTKQAPLLEQISQETQRVHDRLSMSIVHLHLPQHADPGAPADEFIRKWNQQLEPGVKQKLQEQLSVRQAQPGGEDDVFSLLRSGELGSSVVLMRPFDGNDVGDQSLRLLMVPQRREAPRAMGLVIDERGLVLVPNYVDREVVGDRKIRVLLHNGEHVEAAFVGSDRQTNVTLLRLTRPAATPADLADAKPADGSLVLVFSPNDTVHLAVWTGGNREIGIVVTPNGRVAGFANGGQFLSAQAATPIVQQLAEFGHVKRALLGVRVTEVRAEDPARQAYPKLGQQPAMLVQRVYAESAADKSGLREGDFILSVAGESVGDLPTFAAAIANRQGAAEMRILRDGQPLTVKVEFARQ